MFEQTPSICRSYIPYWFRPTWEHAWRQLQAPAPVAYMTYPWSCGLDHRHPSSRQAISVGAGMDPLFKLTVGPFCVDLIGAEPVD
jgi:hypothetical protein